MVGLPQQFDKLWSIGLGAIAAKSVIVGLCTIVAGCSQTSAQAENSELRLTGSSTVTPLITEFAEQYQIKNPNIDFKIQTGGSNQGIEDVRTGANDIGMVSRSLKEDEQTLQVFTIAQDGIALLLHQSNPVSELSPQQIVDLYTGKINNWQQVGGDDMPITVLNKTPNHATLGLFTEYFDLTPAAIQSDQLVGDNEDMLKTVRETPSAIGYVSIGAAEYQIVHGLPLKLLPLEGVPATIENVSSGDFPLARPLNLITQTTPRGLQKDFIDFALSPDVENIIKRQAFVPANP